MITQITQDLVELVAKAIHDDAIKIGEADPDEVSMDYCQSYARAAIQAISPFAHEPLGKAELRGEPDWWYRDLDPDECGYSPHEALRWTRDYRVDMLHSSYRGPTKFAFRAPVIGDPDEDEVLLFDTEEEALAAAEERYAALQMKGGDHDR